MLQIQFSRTRGHGQILAEEYIETAKNNPEFFTNKGDSNESSHLC